MFSTVFTYKVAFFPFPAVFITAVGEASSINLVEAEKIIVSTMLSIVEKAQRDYKAVIIVNEPNAQTHNLDFGEMKNAVVACCSLQFQSIAQMNTFIQNQIQNHE